MEVGTVAGCWGTRDRPWDRLRGQILPRALPEAEMELYEHLAGALASGCASSLRAQIDIAQIVAQNHTHTRFVNADAERLRAQPTAIAAGSDGDGTPINISLHLDSIEGTLSQVERQRTDGRSVRLRAKDIRVPVDQDPSTRLSSR
jgi:hypothetical protein